MVGYPSQFILTCAAAAAAADDDDGRYC